MHWLNPGAGEEQIPSLIALASACGPADSRASLIREGVVQGKCDRSLQERLAEGKSSFPGDAW